jgi:Tfp pilus assembly protein PilX
MRARKIRGSALVTALAILMVLFLTGSGVLALSIQSMRRSTFDAMRTRAIALADAGVEKAIYYLRTTAPDGTVAGTWRTSGLTESMAGLGDYTMVVKDGTGPNAGKIVITSSGRAYYSSTGQVASTDSDITWAANNSTPSMVKSLRVIIKLTREDISIWNNAIFGGVGQAGRSINGNVAIRGSVHLLGDGEPWTDLDGDQNWDAGEAYTDSNHNGAYDAGEAYSDSDGDGHRDPREAFDDVNGNGACDPPLTVTDLTTELGGTASIGNNYDLMPSSLRNLIPNPPTTVVGGETVETLNAKLRAKHGYVSISGTATVGAPDAPGGSPMRKEFMDGTFVSDGFGGNAGAAGVHSDNGPKMKYDLGDGLVTFPTLTAPTVKSGVNYPTYMDYLRTSGLNINANVTLEPGTSYGPVYDAKGNYLYVDTNGNMVIRGIVYVNGNINIQRDGGNRDMRYVGRGTLVSTGSVSIGSSLVPSSSTFPINHALGVISRHDINLGTDGGSAQLELAGAYYAQERITSAKQNELLGTFVTSYFSMANVPRMYQVPVLPDYLPPGMPGSGRIWVKTVRIDSWRQITELERASLAS